MVSDCSARTKIGTIDHAHRLCDIDVTIDRNLVYGALRAPLVLTYIGGVTNTQTSFRVLTGQEQPPQVTVVSQAPLRLQYGYSK